jgi:RNA polymerase sigma factor (sigma-70 family)
MFDTAHLHSYVVASVFPEQKVSVEPWLAQLNTGNAQAAWDLFHDRYRRLMLATIRRLVPDHDDVMDLFSDCCQALTADDFARLRRFSATDPRGATTATWLVAVVRNLTIDWRRQREGRPRNSIPQGLSQLEQAMYAVICIQGHTYAEAYELIQSRGESSLSFPEFLRQVRVLHLRAPCPGSAPRHLPPPPGELERALHPAPGAADAMERAELGRRLAAALARQPDDVCLAVELFVVEQMSASDVARVVGWSSSKTVYNRVYRALAAVRATLEQEGIHRSDL